METCTYGGDERFEQDFFFCFIWCLKSCIFYPWSDHCLALLLTDSPTHWRTYRWCYVVNWFLYFYVCRDSFSDLCEWVFPQLYLTATAIWGMGTRWDIFPQRTTQSLIICRGMWMIMMMLQWAKIIDSRHCLQKSDARVGLALKQMFLSKGLAIQSVRDMYVQRAQLFSTWCCSHRSQHIGCWLRCVDSCRHWFATTSLESMHLYNISQFYANQIIYDLEFNLR